MALSRAQQRLNDMKASEKEGFPISEIPAVHKGLCDAFASHKTLPYEFRKQQLEQLKKMLEENETMLTDALRTDLYKDDAIAYITDISMMNSDVNDALKELKSWMQPTTVPTPWTQVKGVTSSYIYPEPLGVALIMAPWNFPLALCIQPLIGAIAAGCCACVKPSSITCQCSRALATLLPKYMDSSCFRVITGGHDVSDALLEQKWDLIFFTGSVPVGKHVHQAAAKHLTPCILELGGKSPTIVDESADLDIAAKRIVMGKFQNAGQTCIAPDYILCQEKVFVPFYELLRKYILQFYGENAQKSHDLSRIVAEKQFKKLDTILKEDEDKAGGEHGASSSSSSSSKLKNLPPLFTPVPGGGHRLMLGGHTDAADLYVQPTLLICDITTTSRFMKEEVFGPILPLIPLPDENFIETCVEYIRQHDKPLSCYLFSDDKHAKEMVLSRVSTGSLAFNECVLQLMNPYLPFGGVGSSGMGRYHGKFSFEAFSHMKAVLDKAKIIDFESRYPPYTPEKLAALKKLV